MTDETTESVHVVYWEGPFTPKKISKLLKIKDKKLDKWVLYSVYGSHPLYGNNALLYIGMIDDTKTKTERNVAKRLAEHDYWFDEQYFGKSKVYFASIDENDFVSWSKDEKINRYSAPKDVKLVENVEKLLIFSQQPVYNTKNRYSAKGAEYLRVFNTGTKGLLAPEVSGRFHIENPNIPSLRDEGNE